MPTRLYNHACLGRLSRYASATFHAYISHTASADPCKLGMPIGMLVWHAFSVCLFGKPFPTAYKLDGRHRYTLRLSECTRGLASCGVTDFLGSEFDNTPLGRLSINEVVRLRWSHGSHTVAFCLSSENARVTYEHGDISNVIHAASTCLCAPLLRPGFCDLGIDPYRV